MSDLDETFDWVVVGSDAGSMSSALVMRRAGKSVLIVEKAETVGGTTAKSGGVMWIPGNRFMAEQSDPDSAEAAIAYLDAVCTDGPEFPGTSHQRRLAYVAEAPKMVDFLMGEGVALERGSKFWPDYYDELAGGCKTSRTVVAKPFDKKQLGAWEDRLQAGFLSVPARLDDGMKLPFASKSWKIRWLFVKIAIAVVLGKLTGKHWVTAGAALQGRMLQAALRAGADIRTGAGVQDLIVQNGAVTGVVIERDGKPWRIGARLGVLVNAGGFAQNQAMRDRYMPGTQAAWSNTIPSDTGDLFPVLEKAGGVLAQMDQMVGYQTTRMPGFDQAFVKPPGQGLTGKPHAILVDQSGVRYMNEGGSYELYCETMLERNKTVPAVPSWAIFDAQFAGQYAVGGVKMGNKTQGWVGAGYLKQADTIGELAAQIGIDPATLQATVARWNAFVDKGVDDDFGRGARAYDQWLGDPFHGPNPALGRIDKAPFHAVDIVPGDVSTYGGVVTDVHARVLTAQGAPIAGLYACGVASASVFGGVYPGAGASVGPSLTFGCVAAKHAAGVGNSL